jgi:serine/threonine-protein kinase
MIFFFQWSTSMLALGIVGSFILMTGLGVPLEPPGYRRRTVGRIQSMLWNSHFGAWLAGVLTPKQRGVPESNFRPTELALGAAVEELFAALPAAYREHVGDVPSVGARLMTDVAWLRSEVQRLEQLRDHAMANEAAEIDPMLSQAKGQLGKAVSALEQMRLELMRLHGGAKDTRPLTTSLHEARRMIGGLARLRSAEDELEIPHRRLAFDARTPSPA